MCNECLQFVRTPVLLKCQHTFCQKCAEPLIKVGYIYTHDKNIFMCPRCRFQTPLKEQG